MVWPELAMRRTQISKHPVSGRSAQLTVRYLRELQASHDLTPSSRPKPEEPLLEVPIGSVRGGGRYGAYLALGVLRPTGSPAYRMPPTVGVASGTGESACVILAGSDDSDLACTQTLLSFPGASSLPGGGVAHGSCGIRHRWPC
jgi:hypothetical protein